MIKKREATGKLFTPSGNFIILKWGFITIGTETQRKLYDAKLEVEYYPNRTGSLDIHGDYVYKKFPQPEEIYIYVEENEE